MQNEQFDALLQMQGNGSIVNPFMEMFNAKKLIGFYRKEDYCPNPETFFLYPNQGHEIHRMNYLLESLDIPVDSDGMDFPVEKKDFEEIERLKGLHYVCLHPGARDPKRRWPTRYFAQIADYCLKKGFQVVITGIPEEEKIARDIVSISKGNIINMVGKTSLGRLGALIQKSHFVLSNDTGIMHIAAALQKKSLTISQNSESERWSPLNKELHHVVCWTDSSNLDSVMDALTFFI